MPVGEGRGPATVHKNYSRPIDSDVYGRATDHEAAAHYRRGVAPTPHSSPTRPDPRDSDATGYPRHNT